MFNSNTVERTKTKLVILFNSQLVETTPTSAWVSAQDNQINFKPNKPFIAVYNTIHGASWKWKPMNLDIHVFLLLNCCSSAWTRPMALEECFYSDMPLFSWDIGVKSTQSQTHRSLYLFIFCMFYCLIYSLYFHLSSNRGTHTCMHTGVFDWKADIWTPSLYLNIHEHLLSTKNSWEHRHNLATGLYMCQCWALFLCLWVCICLCYGKCCWSGVKLWKDGTPATISFCMTNVVRTL